MGLRTWKRKNYTVEMVDFDYNLKAFEIRQGDKIQTIYPADIEEMELIIADLDAGEDVAGWEDGLGNMIVIDGRNNIITIKIEEEEEMKRTHVIFSNRVGAPAEVITFGRDEGYDLQEIEEAENDGKRYAHYYEERFNEYDVLEWHYIETVNA